jgi:pimeloyl-ACP methyl ester carboxylesterase
VDQFANLAMHAQTAALSARGVHRVVPETKHNIQLDRPEAVIAAIDEVLNQLALPGE